jgi:hypothetical protein
VIKRWRESRGGLRAKLKTELEAEGLQVLEERMEGEISFRGYEAMGQRPRSGHQSTTCSLALTEKRLVIQGTGAVQLEARPGPVTSAVEEPGVLTLAYEAGDIYPTRSGSVTMRLRTPRANDIHARLKAWTETSRG